MDVGELLDYTQTLSTQKGDDGKNIRRRPDSDPTSDGPPSKKRKADEQQDLNSGPMLPVGPGGELPDLDALEKSGGGAAPLDETGLKRLLLQFERKVLKNQELRIKFSDTPNKFMDSEIELFDILQEMHVISTQAELYPLVVQLNCVSTILGLLSHENTDVACAVVDLLQELTDIDDADEISEVAVLMDALIDSQIIARLVANMERLDEKVKEESEGVYHSLEIIENLLDYKPDLTKDAKTLIVWLLRRFKAKLPFDGNKLYASEILAILLQNSEDNRTLLGELNGIDILLQQIAYFKRHDPATADEHEYMENLFDCLCSALLLCPLNRELFYKGEGIELMNLILREKRKKGSDTSVRMGALKVLNHALCPPIADDRKAKDQEMLEACCNKLVDIYGLRIIFPVFMKPITVVGGSKYQKKKEAKNMIDSVEEHCTSIILMLLKCCSQDNVSRVVSKFLESDCEKTDRLVELHFKYADKLLKCDAQIMKERASLQNNDEDMDEEEVYMRRLSEGGLFTLQLIDQIMIMVTALQDKLEVANPTAGSDSIKQRMQKLINMKANTQVDHMKLIKSIVKDYIVDLDDEVEKKNLQDMLEGF